MSQLFLNNYSTRLTNPILATDTSITVDDVLPVLAVDDFYILTLADKAGVQEPEIIKVTGVTGNVLTVERAQEGTAAQDWSASTPVEMRWTAGAVEEISRVIESIESIYLEWSNTSIYITQSATATITNYDSLTEYTVSATLGTATISGDTITYLAPATAGMETLTVNGRVVSFEILPAGISAPSFVSPSNGSTDNNVSVIFDLSAFEVIPSGSDTHVSTTIEVATDINFTNIIATETVSTGDLTSVTVTGHVDSTQYYARAKYTSTTLESAWSSTLSYQTKDIFSGLIGTAGEQGFGVGIYPDESDPAFTALGLTGVTGYQDPASDNYGNYQHNNGSAFVFVPKFYYRIGNTGAANYAEYGANTVEIAGIDQFSDTASAESAGWSLHRAFIDGGAEKHGFFFSRFDLSHDGTNVISKAGKVPLSLTTSTSYTRSDGVEGGTGILADSVLLSRSMGAGYNQMTAFQMGAIAILSIAHAQAATSSTYCAWYDSAGVTNYPKGCNSALADVDDGTVTYTTAGDSGTAHKPLTGATTEFAKTTHNGQACGIPDLNGSMYKPVLGITVPGASATSTTAVSDDVIHILKESVAHADLTAGYNTGTDAWGDATHIGTLYDQTTSSHALGSTAGTVYWGSGSNAVFSQGSAVDGFIPKDDTSTDATGTNQFGTDYLYRYKRENWFPLASGTWSISSLAGLFCRNFLNSRSYDYTYAAARASAYAG